ncbi:type I-C CRISPR-associated endonuclease Cas1c [Parachitinimonas caeni]|uniref:CRISPR-associated endonuclease Cas1 n=1 Tax=Parachitinimonas caeni TaxID=3031301 RepID=A0ABT7DZ11_9NEIS|nr:type I-C CRISPR-associated endonuclease Cas1c [Parachitinimonas caeni]MDK2125297.1 type I-C CRISPR-associated endonuclease Cas1c [Parachitinimonas caeni]
MQLLNTLYVTLPEAYLHLDNDTLRVEIGRETRLRVPLHHLTGVVTFGHVNLSAPLMHRLAEEAITLTLLDTHGRFKARLEGAQTGNILLRQAQHARAADPTFALSTARACVAGKLKNCRQVLLRGAREAKDESDRQALERGAADLAASLRALPTTENLDALRGTEGEAARQYFACLNHLIRADQRPHFRFEGRTRRPPRDPVNALLSFLYTLITHDCRAACEAAGLDPQLGFLHVVRPGRPALALDLVEEFRPFADRLVLSLINRKQVTPQDFKTYEGGAVLLEGDARRNVSVAYQERKQEAMSHPLFEQTIALGLLPLVQARLMARAIRQETAGYLPFTFR